MANNNINHRADSIEIFDSISRLTKFTTLPKYGDGDVSSKRRRSLDVPDKRDKGPSNEFHVDDYEQFKTESLVNSSFQEHLNQNLDFKGGLLKENKKWESEIKSPLINFETKSQLSAATTSRCAPPSKLSAKNTLIITEKPSSTSKGFENTFKLLQNNVKSSNALANQSPECELPTKLDVELEAEQRLHVLQEHRKFNKDCSIVADASLNENCSCCPQKQLMHFLHEFTRKSLPNNKSSELGTSQASNTQNTNEELIAVDTDSELDGLNLLYHATVCADGTKRLRVLRNNKVLKSKVLCGNRVSQMTRVYDDIEAVTRLLEEKEKDLELTVQIGKELLTQNNSLENRISELESDLKTSNDDRAQLVHELNKKNELIAVLTNDADDGSEADTPTFSKSVTFDLLQRKVNSLQDENKSLKMEASQLAKQTDDVEAHERQLVEDISSQLNEANSQFENLSLELERQREENRLQHEQIVSLTARLAEAEMRLHQLTHDNDEHVTLLSITKQNQNSLALELVEFKQRYQEVLELLQETQEQLRKQRKRAMPQARSGSFMSGMGASGMSGSGYGFLQPDSLQSELIESTFSDNSLDSGISADKDRANDRISRLMSQLGSNSCGISGGVITTSALGGASIGVGGGAATTGTIPPYQRVFDTVRCASKSGNYADSSGVNSLSMSQLGAMSMSSSSGPRMSAVAVPAGSYYRHDSLYDNYNAMAGGGKTFSCESLTSQPDENYPSQPKGVPGVPGAKDLEAALKRLTPAEVLARRAMLSYAPAGTYNYDEQQHHSQNYQQHSSALPLGVRTPESIMSTGSSGISSSAHMSSSMHQWRLPEKLQIIKPMEGSQTLHHWSRLATPTLSGLLEKRPGVTIRGGRDLEDIGMQVYTLEDVEEDFSEDLPGKQFEAPGCTYTFTNSMVMHPDDGFVNDLSFLSQSQMSSRMASTSTSRQPSCPQTPRSGLSRKNSCSTFSVNLGLASMLNERGIKAVTPSALNTPAGPNFSPTVTPCNSPEGSPTRSRSPEPLFGLIASGADLIRRKLIGGDIERPTRNQQKQQQQRVLLSRLERRALQSLRLVEKVESIGLENIISSQPCAMSQLASGIADRSSSPMAQFSSLKSLHTSSNSIVDDIHFEPDQIKSVLHKGLNKSKKSHNASDSSSAYTSDNDGTLSDSSDNSFRNEYHKSTSSAHRLVDGKVSNESSHTVSAQNIDLQSQSTTAPKATAATAAATPPVTLPFQTETRIKQMQRQKSRRNLKNGMAAQRPDLGRVRNDLGKVEKPLMTATNTNQEASKTSTMSSNDKDGASATQSITQSFVGTVSSLLFGRKGGWL